MRRPDRKRDRAFALYGDAHGHYDQRIATHVMFEAERITGANFEPNLLIEFLRLPFRKFEFSTPMSPDRAASVLQEIVEPRKLIRWPFSGGHRDFEGRVAGGRFMIRRVITYQNAWLPVIEGSFRNDGPGTLVTVNIRLMWSLVAFMSGILALLLYAFAAIDWRGPGTFASRVFLLGGMLFIYLVSTVSFATEMRIAIRRLLKLLRPGSAGSGLSF